MRRLRIVNKTLDLQNIARYKKAMISSVVVNSLHNKVVCGFGLHPVK